MWKLSSSILLSITLMVLQSEKRTDGKRMIRFYFILPALPFKWHQMMDFMLSMVMELTVHYESIFVLSYRYLQFLHKCHYFYHL